MKIYRGGCHCARVRFELRTDTEIDTFVECDCSICVKKGILHYPAEDEQFTILSGADDLVLYRFHSNSASHWFCRICGIHPFGRPRNNPQRYTINVRCLDDFETIAPRAARRRFEGKHHPKDAGV